MGYDIAFGVGTVFFVVAAFVGRIDLETPAQKPFAVRKVFRELL
jgi:hypothetical protein